MIRLVAATLLDLPGDRWRIPVGRGSLTKFEVEDGEIRLVGMPEGDDVD
jgi:broad specificity phosphatase PhoE